jgi:hypothetical protein
MVPVSKHGDRPPEDLTARARIRDAALAQFAERGYAGTTIKGIAEAAGFSIGLVQHHFGAKNGLRLACDELVIEVQDSGSGIAEDRCIKAIEVKPSVAGQQVTHHANSTFRVQNEDGEWVSGGRSASSHSPEAAGSPCRRPSAPSHRGCALWRCLWAP